ncbi:hypothetical protein GOB27_30325 [Sinorhizobium meliloti]|nr:hypothetical protein [Sinorhizobium meliloti]
MGGQAAVRGFAIQTLVCLLDALVDGSDWTAVTIEPVTALDKVDILWEFDGGRKKAVQVKSSQNSIGRSHIEGWCKELVADKQAQDYELRLAGPLAAGALTGGDFKGVKVPPPSSIIVQDLIEQAITKLDQYLVSAKIEAVPLTVRTALIDICAAKLIAGSTAAEKIARPAFDGWLLQWITAAYPQAVAARLGANCEVVWGIVNLESPRSGGGPFQLVLPITVYNTGGGASIVEWFVVIAKSGQDRWLYVPDKTIFEGNKRPFTEFVVAPGAYRERDIEFVPAVKDGFRSDAWKLGDYQLDLLAKFSTEGVPRAIKTGVVTIDGSHMSLINNPGSVPIRVSSLDSFLQTI